MSTNHKFLFNEDGALYIDTSPNGNVLLEYFMELIKNGIEKNQEQQLDAQKRREKQPANPPEKKAKKPIEKKKRTIAPPR